MAGYDFNVQPAQIESPLGAYGKVMQVRQGEQGYQVGQIELKQKQQELADEQTFRASMQDPSLRGKTIGEVADILAASGHLSPQGWAKYKQLDITQRKDTAALTQTELENRAKAHAATQELYNNVMNAPVDPSQPIPEWPQVAQAYNSIPGNQKQPLDPNQPLSKQQLQQFGPLLDMNNAYLAQEAARRKAEADAKKAPLMEAGGAIYDTSGAKPNLVGGQPPVAQLQMQDWLRKNPGKGPSDYEVAMKKIVPAYNFNLQNSGATGGGQSGQPSAMAQAVANGQMKWGDVISARTPQSVKNAFTQEVLAINPNFKSSDYDVSKKLDIQFSSGDYSKNLNAIDTSRQHMQLFKSLGAQLGNGDLQAWNKLGNALGIQFGSDKATNFNIAKQFFSGEVAKAVVNGGGTGAERDQLAQSINTASSPEQLAGAFATADGLLAGKQKALRDTYESWKKNKTPNFGNQGPSSSGPTLTNQNQGGGRPPLSSFEK